MSAEVESLDREYNKGSADIPPRGFDPELPYYYKGGDSCIICLGQGDSLVVLYFILLFYIQHPANTSPYSEQIGAVAGEAINRHLS